MPARPADGLVIGACRYLKPYLDGHLPDGVEARWVADEAEAIAVASGIEVGWFDFFTWDPPVEIYRTATDLRWTTTVASGIEHLPIDILRDRGVRLTNGAGINAAVVAEYAVMGVLVGAKRFDDVLRAHDRSEWLQDSPGRVELEGSRALIVGYGAIGRAIGQRLKAFDVMVDAVRNHPTPDSGEMGPNDWQTEVGDYDFIVLAAPSSPNSAALVDAAVIAAMKPTAWLVNVGRGKLIERAPLLDALSRRTIGGAFLDVTDPEPLPADDGLWKMPNAIVTMHLAGRSQRDMMARGARFFLANLGRYIRGEPLANEVTLMHGS